MDHGDVHGQVAGVDLGGVDVESGFLAGDDDVGEQLVPPGDDGRRSGPVLFGRGHSRQAHGLTGVPGKVVVVAIGHV